MFQSLYHIALSLHDHMLPCMSKQVLGMDCPGCGLQRSVLLLFNGEFADAFYMFPAIYTLLPLFLVMALSKIITFKYANYLIIVLSTLSVSLILINYFFKLIAT